MSEVPRLIVMIMSRLQGEWGGAALLEGMSLEGGIGGEGDEEEERAV